MLIYSRYTWWVGAMVGLALLFAAAGQVRALSPVQGVFLTLTNPVERILSAVFRPAANVLSGAGSRNDLRTQNDQLRTDNERLQNRVTELEQDVALIDELKAALKVSESQDAGTRVVASVVHRDASPFSDVISINQGASHGIRPGMVALSPQGSLLGTVTSVFGDRAFVRLITDGTSRVAAQVQGTPGADGLVQGGANRKLTFELAQADIRPGDVIVTSGLGGNYPANIPIGRVTEVTGSAQDLYRKVSIESQVRLSTVQTVLILTSFTPQRIGLEAR
jgi:rod shape-determining protein MreC